MDNEYAMRRQRVNEWYAPARFGMFYHWGLFTGGGSSEGNPKWHSPLKYSTLADFEAAAAPEEVARNLVALTKSVGARYMIFTALHSGERWCVLSPTRVAAFLGTTKQDYIGALVKACHKADLRLILYMTAGPSAANWDVPQQPLLTRECVDPKIYLEHLKKYMAELIERHGEQLAGFWFDGIWDRDIPEFVHGLSPRALAIINNQTGLYSPGVDFGTTEFLTGPCDPPYNRPSGLVRANFQNALLPPRLDYNEDIPTCNDWWHGSPYQSEEQLRAKPYVTDPTHWVKEMVSSLGQRRCWNYALGLGPRIDGTTPPMYQPMIDVMSRFMAWAAESIYDTQGGATSLLQPGWVNDGGFVSVTQSLREPAVHYVHVTTAPSKPKLCVQKNEARIASVTDLRTGQPIYFADFGHLELGGVDWADVGEYGAKVIKVVVSA